MEFYLLGDEQQEATGYLYLEFRKDSLEEYRTIGIGMRAVRGKGIDFWGFCLCDGRRIGEGIRLYEDIGEYSMPLSKQKLKNLLNDSDNWADNQNDYKKLVNDRIFQFRELRQYDQLIKLLIEVRAPKLSKEAVRPSAIKKILNDALQILTDDDLSAMVSTMEKLDSLEDTLHDYHASMRDAAVIRNEYTRYNQFMLGMKGQNYLNAKSKTEAAKSRLHAEQRALAASQEELGRQNQMAGQAARLLQQANAQKLAMGSDDLSEKAEQLKSDREQRREQQKQLETMNVRLEKMLKDINKREVDLRGIEREQQEKRDVFTSDCKDLKKWNEILLLGDEHRQYFDLLGAGQLDEARHQNIKSDLSRLKVRINGILELLCKIDQANKDYDSACQAKDKAAAELNRADATRAYLAMNGIPHTAFYEAVDFAPDLPQAERDLLEAQLEDSGLLDALIVPAEYRAQIENLLREYPDSFLIPGEPLDNPIMGVSGLIADTGNRLSGAAEQCLRGISRSSLDAQTALLPDGRFRCGMIQGHSVAEHSACFVGAAACRANRERQIKTWEEKREAVNLKRQTARNAADTLQGQLERLDWERQNIPTTEDLDQAMEMLLQAHKREDYAQAELTKQEDAEQTVKRQVSGLDQDLRVSSQGLPYARTIEAYEEAKEAADLGVELLNAISVGWSALLYITRSVSDTTEYIEEERDNADSLRRSLNQQQQALALLEARMEEINRFLERPENRARVERLKELNAEIDKQTEIKESAGIECAKLGERITQSEIIIGQKNQELVAFVINENELERYFAEDLALGFTITRENESLTQYAKQAYSKIQASDRDRTPEKLGEALRNNYQQHNNTLLKYLPKIETVFDAPTEAGMLRQRLVITLQKDGLELPLHEFIHSLQSDIELTMTVLEDKDRELFEDILTDTASHKLRARIEDSLQWSRDMNALMKSLHTSMGLTFSLDWKPKAAESEEDLDTAYLVMLLNKDRTLLTREDSQRVSSHFRAKVKTARRNAEERDELINYADLIREVLDYRTWYEFRIYYHRKGEDKKELTDHAFNQFSGGERAMAMYLPQFAAVSAQYQKCNGPYPRLLGLDEAFAGVDDINSGAMFELVNALNFDYILNSQALWGCYPCVSSLNIADFHRPANARVITILRYLWNGSERILTET